MSEPTWTYGVCDYCLKNSHEEVKMIKEKLVSIDSKVSPEEYWTCPVCGSIKKF